MKNNTIVCAISLFVIPLALQAAQPKAHKETPEEAEAKTAAAEDEAERKIDPETMKFQFEGKVKLYSSDELSGVPEGVIGVFSSSGKTYLLKGTPTLRQELGNRPSTVILFGRPRNEGKYFVAQSIVDSGGAAPQYARKRGGI